MFYYNLIIQMIKFFIFSSFTFFSKKTLFFIASFKKAKLCKTTYFLFTFIHFIFIHNIIFTVLILHQSCLLFHFCLLYISLNLVIIFLGAGRKIRDPNMEKKLMDWYNNYHCKQHRPINSRLIRKMAMDFSSFSDFRASKGWLEKFKKRYHIKY